MENLEKIQKVCDVAGVSFQEAKNALENSSWDLIDALVYLEDAGKFKVNGNEYTTKAEKPEPEPSTKEEKIKMGATKLGNKFIEILNKTLYVKLKISKHKRELISIPMLVVILLVILNPPIVIMLSLLSLLFGFRYSMQGLSFDNKVNDILNKASNTAENFTNNVKKEIDD